MAAKLSLIFLAIALFQITQIGAGITKRDAPVTTEKSEIENTLKELQQSIDAFINKVQTSELYQNATRLVDEFGGKLKQQGEELVSHFKNATTST